MRIYLWHETPFVKSFVVLWLGSRQPQMGQPQALRGQYADALGHYETLQKIHTPHDARDMHQPST